MGFEFLRSASLASRTEIRRELASLQIDIPRGFDWVTIIQPENCAFLFPTVGCRADDDLGWKVLVQGDVYTIGHVGLTKKLLLHMLQRLLRASKESLQGETFRQRISRFIARDEKGKVVQVRIGEQEFLVPGKSGPTGHFSGLINVPDAYLPGLAAGANVVQQTRLAIAFPEGGERQVVGDVFLVPKSGISVISDIDDTVKHSEVGCRRMLLQNTFLNPFEVVQGMTDVYQRWAQQGAAFHYVSSSPWHLYQPLAELLAAAQFPAGSYHLRSFRLRDHFLRRLLMMRRSGKGSIITSLLKMFPARQFVLVGDSGEHDPEIYGTIARRFPTQVRKIYIRDLAGPKSSTLRFTKAFRQVPTDLWQLFRRSDELADLPHPF